MNTGFKGDEFGGRGREEVKREDMREKMRVKKGKYWVSGGREREEGRRRCRERRMGKKGER